MKQLNFDKNLFQSINISFYLANTFICLLYEQEKARCGGRQLAGLD
jgi:hypothetical protein